MSGCFGRVRLAALAWAILLPAVAGCAAADGMAPIPQRAYIWQRVWSPALGRAVLSHAGSFAALDILGAEIAFAGKTPTTVITNPDWAVLSQTARPVGLVVRVGPHRRSWAEDTPAVEAVIAAARRVVSEARAHGIEPAELQLDFDAATSQLLDYARLLPVVRAGAGPVRLVITALPTWLASPDFPALAQAADAYVLQVHSLQKPRSFGDVITLCDTARAEQWIRQAAAMGRPFRVALACYGYRMAFDRSGQFCGLEAEGPPRLSAPGVRMRTVWSDPAAIAGLVATLAASRPPACESISWFRLPSDVDELTWRWATLAVAMRGELPRPDLVLSAVAGPDGVVELELRNAGSDRGDLRAFRLSWNNARLVAADAVGGWTLTREGEHVVRLAPPPSRDADCLQAGDSLRLGWLRLDAPASVVAAPL